MLKIIFDAKEKKFIVVEGAEYFKEDFVFGDKWNCRVNCDGSVKCTAVDTINGRYFEICLKITKTGLVTVNKMKGGIRKNIRCFRVRNWPVVGVITLTGGPIEKRNAFFNDINSYKEPEKK